MVLVGLRNVPAFDGKLRRQADAVDAGHVVDAVDRLAVTPRRRGEPVERDKILFLQVSVKTHQHDLTRFADFDIKHPDGTRLAKDIDAFEPSSSPSDVARRTWPLQLRLDATTGRPR